MFYGYSQYLVANVGILSGCMKHRYFMSPGKTCSEWFVWIIS